MVARQAHNLEVGVFKSTLRNHSKKRDKFVKASGGVRTHEDLLAMVEAGANRIGTSNGTKII